MAFNGGSPAAAVIEALGWTLLDFVWQGALIALLYGLVRAAVASRPASWRLGAGYLALAGFTLAPTFTLLKHLENISVAFGSVSVASPAAGISSLSAVAVNATSWSLDPLLPYLVSVWSLGVAGLICRGLWRWHAIRQICLAAQPLPSEWQQRIVALHARVGLRIQVLVRESAEVAAPILVGWLKPTVLLPLGLCARMPIDQLELILTHEFAHVRRLDAWANAAQLALETLLFYHPAVHWVGRRVREDRELCCDELVTAVGGDRLTYARALLALAEEHRESYAGNLALAATGGVLLGRVEKLLGVSHRQQQAPSLIRLEGLLPATLISIGVVMLANPFESPWISDLRSDQAQSLAPISLSQPSMAAVVPALEIVVRDLQPSVTRLVAVVAPTSEAPPISATLAARTEAAALDTPTIVSKADAIMLASAPAVLKVVQAPVVAPPAAEIDEMRTTVAASEASEAVESPESLRVLKRTAPLYPRAPLERGVEGSAELSFRIDERGKAIDIQVERASQKTFGVAAIDALKRWRFDPAHAGQQRHAQGFDFNLPTADAEGACLRNTGTRLCRRIP